MNAIERAKKHWADRLTDVREIQVPEWGDEGEPMVIFVGPSNLAQRSKLFKLAQANDMEAVAETLILRARDKDGLPLFKPSDRETLMTSCDPEVVGRIAKEINEDLALDDEEGLEDAAKN